MSIQKFLDLASEIFWDDLYIYCGDIDVYHYTPLDQMPSGVAKLEMQTFRAEALKGEKLALIIYI